MPRFIIRFIKDVLGERGQVSEICQATLELDARDERQAEESAKAKFCDLHRTHDWSLHSDRIKVDPADFPS
jgi:hypothetical protein